MNVFVVDDDKIIRQGIRSIIEKSALDCTVVGEASDGELALKELEQCDRVDLLITDIRMPVMDGMELIKQVKERYRTMKIIVLSGYDEFKFVRNAFIYGTTDYLLKPFNKNEFLDLLKKILLSIEQEIEQNSYLKESRDLLVANTLTHLFTTQLSDYNEEAKNLKKVNLDLEYNKYFVGILRIDNYYKQKTHVMEYDGALDRINNCITNRISDITIDCQLLHYVSGFELIFLFYSDSIFDTKENSERLFQLLQGFDLEDTTYTLGIGNVYSKIENTINAYQEAFDAVESRFYLGHGHLINYNEIKNKLLDISYDLEPILDKLAHYLELYDYVNCKKIIDNIFLDLSYIRAVHFRQYLKILLDQLKLRVKDFQEALYTSEKDYEFYIENINTYNELKSYLCSLIRKSIEYIQNEREKRSKMRIEQAKKYISEHYAENITLNDVANSIDLNSSYFSNLFKSEEGINFSDYLLETRMKMARKLLRDPTLKIYEIGCKVGYEDAVSFGRAFKKKVGMSPKEYRDTVY